MSKVMLLSTALSTAVMLAPAHALDIKRLLASERSLNDVCQGATDPEAPAAKRACAARDAAFEALLAAGWCYGKPGQAEIDKHWRKCPKPREVVWYSPYKCIADVAALYPRECSIPALPEGCDYSWDYAGERSVGCDDSVPDALAHSVKCGEIGDERKCR